MYFITFATVGWIDVFTRKHYRDLLLANLRYCQQHKGLVIYAWCILSNHVHLVVAAKEYNLSDILREFKSYTAKLLITALQQPGESRKEWMLPLFRAAGEANSNNTTYQFWPQYNHYKEVHSQAFAFQKFDYIHNNPVEAGLVDRAEDYPYSSARDHFYGTCCGLLEVKFWDE
jgi:putative transposase